MKKKAAIVLSFALILPCLLFAGDDTAVDLVERMDTIIRGNDSSVGTMTMTVKKKRWRKARTIEMKFWEIKRKGDKIGKSYILITSPIDEEGKGFLKLGNEMWSYFPDVNATTKIPPSMMLQNWMGSDFTNDDLVRESSIVLDYDHRVLKREQKDGFTLVTIELIPKPEAPVTWGKIIVVVRESDAMPTLQKYYNEKGELVRVMKFEDIREMDGRVLPTKWILLPKDKPGDSTVIIMDDMRFDVKIDPAVFTMANLRKGGG